MSPMATTNQPSKDTSGKKSRQPDAPTSPVEGIQTYLKGVRSEWGKISWPTWRQIWGQTIVVLVMVSTITLILFIMDYSFHYSISMITPHRS
jgi:preprotein translocase SecE subunit